MSASVFASKAEAPWLFGRTTDLLAFGGSAALSFALLGVGALTGALHRETPLWAWLLCVVAIDVAHVWTTLYRVYFDGEEVARRPWLYYGLPLACYGVGVACHAHSAELFWRVLAYVAAFHFVRQQYGWTALYRKRAGETSRVDRVIDTAAIYAATVYPLLYWHANSRKFSWFVTGDFVRGLSADLVSVLAWVYWIVMAAFVARQIQKLVRGETVVWGKVLVVATTWACWYVGIVALDSDYAFTVTNVVIHGVPYFVLVFRHARARSADAPKVVASKLVKLGALFFIASVVFFAFAEEAVWDRLVWHDHESVFGGGKGRVTLGGIALALVVPLLALPQSVHYALDGFIWKVRKKSAPELEKELVAGTEGPTR